MIRRPPRSTQSRSSAASDVYKRQSLSRALLFQQQAGASRSLHQSVLRPSVSLSVRNTQEYLSPHGALRQCCHRCHTCRADASVSFRYLLVFGRILGSRNPIDVYHITVVRNLISRVASSWFIVNSLCPITMKSS